MALCLLVPAGLAAPSAPRSSPFLDADRDRIVDSLEARLASMPPDERLGVIVVLDGARASDALPVLRRAAGAFDVRRTYAAALDGFAATVAARQVADLARSSLVLQVEEDLDVHGDLLTGGHAVRADTGRAAYGSTGDRDGFATYSAADSVIAIVDTGIDARHLDLDQGKVIGWKDLIGGLPLPYDDHGHGTHIAGIAAGDGDASGGRLVGMAPGAALVGVKAMTAANAGRTSDVIAGIDWVVANRALYGIDVLSISISAGNGADGTSAAARSVDAAYAAGITVAASAGNRGPIEGLFGTPGDARGAITVGAAADPGEGGWYLAPTSSRGYTLDGRAKPDLVAPGVAVASAATNTRDRHVQMSGTSMATPFVAGAAALLLAQQPALGPAGVRDVLRATAAPTGSAASALDWGAGLLDVERALAALASPHALPEAPARPPTVEDRVAAGGVDRWAVIADGAPLAASALVINYRAPPLGTPLGSPEVAVRIVDGAGETAAEVTGAGRQKVACLGCPPSTAVPAPPSTPAPAAGASYAIEIVSLAGSADYVLSVAGAASIAPVAGDDPSSSARVASLRLEPGLARVKVVGTGGVAIPDARVALEGTTATGHGIFSYGYTGADGTLALAIPVDTVAVKVRELVKADASPSGGPRPSATL